MKDDDQLDDEWFSEKPTWKPPTRQSSRPPPAKEKPIFEEDDIDSWFV